MAHEGRPQAPQPAAEDELPAEEPDETLEAFGVNAGIVAEIRQRWEVDPDSVHPSWAELFGRGGPARAPRPAAPAGPVPATGAAAPVGSNNYHASLTGFPALNVPMGFVEPGLPVGLQLLGRPAGEARLLQIGAVYEKGAHHRRKPTFHPAGPLTG